MKSTWLAVCLAAWFTAPAFAQGAPGDGESFVLSVVQVLGPGSPGSGGVVPQLTVTGPPIVGEPAIDALLQGGLPGAPAQIVFSLTNDPTFVFKFGATIFPGVPIMRIVTILDESGSSSPFLSGPAVTPPELLGVELIGQAAVLDAGAEGGLAFSNGLLVRFGNGSSLASIFAAPQYEITSVVEGVDAGDVNGDGVSDVVAGGFLLFGSGGGLYAPAIETVTNAGVSDIALVDLDLDGDLDVVSRSESSVRVSLGSGDGTFAPGTGLGVLDAVAVRPVDLDDDRVPDLVIGRGADVIDVRIGDGFGGFAASSSTPVSFTPTMLDVADFDVDGTVDVVAYGADGGGAVLLGSGDGTFAPPLPFVAADELVAGGIRAGDLDGDGVPDLVVAHQTAITIPRSTAFLSGLGDGTFGPPTFDTAPTPGATGVDLGDVDGDGDLDAAVSFGSGVLLLAGAGDGTFSLNARFPTGTAASSVRVLSLTNDGAPDLLTTLPAGPVVLPLINRGNGSFDVAGTVGDEVAAVACADLDDDGALDLVSIGFLVPELTLRRGNGDGTFQPALVVPQGGIPVSVDVGDATGDGVPDALVAKAIPGVLTIVAGDGAGGVAGSLDLPVPVLTVGARYVDQDLDGDLDIVSMSSSTGTVRSFLNPGDGAFTSTGDYGVTPLAALFDVADVHGDGFADVLAKSPSSAVLSLRGLGDGTFGPAQFVLDVGRTNVVQLEDVDQDSVLDLVTVAPNGTIEIRRGLGGGGFFVDPTAVDVGISVFAVGFPDINGDGRRDLTYASLEVGGVAVRLGLGDLAYTPAQRFLANPFPNDFEICDLNGDGDVDLLVPGRSALSLMINRGAVINP